MRSGIRLLLTFTLVLCADSLAYNWSTNPGNGSAANPYQISTPEQLMSIGSNPALLDKHFIFKNAIIFNPNSNPAHVFTTALISPDLTFNDWSYGGTPFTGTFDGCGYSIRNLKIQAQIAGSDYLGLFGKLESVATVKNLGVENFVISAANNSSEVGGLCGKNSYGTITYCYTTGVITLKDNSWGAGGLCGHNDFGKIENSHSNISISLTNNLNNLFDSGGLCGFSNGLIVDCYASANVLGGISSERIGGLCGNNMDYGGDYGGRILNCYTSGNVSGGLFVGGLCGDNGSTVIGCHSSSAVSGLRYVGGLCGEAESLVNCYAEGNVTGLSGNSPAYIGGLCGNVFVVIRSCYGAGSITVNDAFAVGSLCGTSYGTISNSYATGPLYNGAGSSALGGLCGVNQDNARIEDCHSTSILTNVNTAGGLCGINMGTIMKSYSIGSVSGNAESERNGGLCGENAGTGLIRYCYSNSNITGRNSLGGLCGLNAGLIENSCATGSIGGTAKSWCLGGLCGNCNAYETDATIRNCYSTGQVTAGSESYSLGGLCGYSTGEISNCFWNVQSSGILISNGGTGLSSAAMMIKANFAMWDFVGESTNGSNEIWRMCVDGVDYPRLSWEFAQDGDFACGDGVDLADLLALAENWLLNEAISPAEFNYACDANGDELINLQDMALLSENWQ